MLLGLLLCAPPQAAHAQICSTRAEMGEAEHSAIQVAAVRLFNLVARNDVAALRQAAIASVAQDFGGIESAVQAHGEILSGRPPVLNEAFLLETNGTDVLPRANFYCGVYRTPDLMGFTFDQLAPGRYAVALFEAKTSPVPYFVTLILKQEAVKTSAAAWKMAGLYIKAKTLLGRDGAWYLEKARAYAARGQNHNAWFFYLTARDLLAPVPFLGTPLLDSLLDEQQALRTTDLPTDAPVTFSVGGRNYRITQVFPVAAEDRFLLVLRHEVPDISDHAAVDALNLALGRAFFARYPEYREAFDGVVARAVEPGGRDFGSLLLVKDLR